MNTRTLLYSPLLAKPSAIGRLVSALMTGLIASLLLAQPAAFAAPPSKAGKADLSSLKLSAGTLSPAFRSDRTEYSATVRATTSALAVTARAATTGAALSVRMNDGLRHRLESGKTGPALPLRTGANTMVIRVTGANGAVKNYRINVTRAEPPPVVTTAPSSTTRATVAAAMQTMSVAAAPVLIPTAPSTFTVSNTNDTGAGSLRQAITDALAAGSGAQTIQAGGVTGTISLQSALPTITNTNITIHGPTSGTLTVTRGTGTFRIFTVTNSGGTATLTLNRLTMTNGIGTVDVSAVADGGGIAVVNSALNMNFCTVSGCGATGDGGAVVLLGSTATTVARLSYCTFSGNTANRGAGISAQLSAGPGTLNMNNCTVSGNTAASNGAGVNLTFASGVFSNCTISGNTASTSNGGGIMVGSGGSLATTNCTVTNNRVAAAGAIGGGIRSLGSAPITLSNSLVVGNFTGSGSTPDDTSWSANTSKVARNSVVGADVSGVGFATVTASQTGTQASPKVVNLGVLANNGGPTQTHRLLATVPELAINLGSDVDAFSLAADQRGVGYNRFNSTVDIGAYETSVTAPTFTGVAPLGSPSAVYGNVNTLSGFSVPPGTDRLLVVTASDSNATTVSAVTFGGTAMTLATSVNDGTTAVDSIWVLPLGTATTATTGDIVMTSNAVAPTHERFISAQTFSGAHQTTPTSGAQNLAGTTSSSVIVTSTTGDLVYDVFDTYRQTSLGAPATVASGSGQATVASGVGSITSGPNPVGGTSAAGFAKYTSSLKPGAASVTMGWTSNAEYNLHLAVNLKQAVVVLPNLTINDVTLSEGNSGTTNFTFTVSLSAPAGAGGVNFDIATANGTASQPGDYTQRSLTAQTIAAGNSTYSFTVSVNGDTANEPSETFFVNVTNVTGAVATDSQGLGTITNDDPLPAFTIDSPSITEGNSGTSSLTFTVSLTPASGRTVTVDYASANTTATAGSDYVATSGSRTFTPGTTTQTISVVINGDTTFESNETFTVTLANATNATLLTAGGTGTITNDDAPPTTAPVVNTPTSASVTGTTATLGGNVASDGGSAVTERGVVYSVTATNSNPQISGTGVTKVTTAGTTGVFTIPVTGLFGGTGYSFAAYATNSVGTTYTTPVSTLTTSVTNTGSTGSAAAVDTTPPSLATQWVVCYSGIFPGNNGAGASLDDDPFIGEIRNIAFSPAAVSFAQSFLPCDGRLLSPTDPSYRALFALIGTIYGGDGTTTFALPDLRGRTPVHLSSTNPLGTKIGAESTTLTTSSLPAHTHTVSGGADTGSTGSGQSFATQQPALALNLCIMNDGLFTSLGWVRVFSFSRIVGGYPCEGTALSIATQPSLFSAIGLSYGGNGTTTFNVPDLRDRAMIGMGTGAGLSARTIGQTGGASAATMTIPTMPAHTHTVPVGTTGSNGGGSPLSKMSPYVVLNPMIATSGGFASITSSQSYGEVRWRADNRVQPEFVACNGASIAISSNSALYSLLGVNFGGDGINNFNVPDLRGRSTTNADNGAGVPAGITSRTRGNTWGAETVTLTTTELPAHTHTFTTSAPPAPEIAVSESGNDVPDGGSFSFGTTTVGTPVTKTFTIANSGTAVLNLSNLTVPSGFTIAANIGSPTVAASGGTTTFQITMSAGAAATPSGTLSFDNDDGNEAPYNFTISGTVTLPPVQPVTFTLGGSPSDVTTTAPAPDNTGAADGTQFDVMGRGGYLAANGALGFPATLKGASVTAQNNQAYFKDTGSGLKRLARSSDAMPGAGGALLDVLPTIPVPGLSSQGDVTLLGTLRVGTGAVAVTSSDDSAMWSEAGGNGLQLLARENDPVTGVSGALIGSFGFGCYATATLGGGLGEAAFTIKMKGASTNSALIRRSITGAGLGTNTVVARETFPAPDTAENFGALNSTLTSAVRMDPTGNLVFEAQIKPSNKFGLWYQPRTGSVAKVFVAGDTAPGTSSATFSTFEQPSMGSGGTFAFRAFLVSDTGDNTGNAKNDGIWRGTTAGGFTCILRRGDAALPGMPVGSKVGNPWSGWLNLLNHGAWRGWIDTAGDGISPYPADTFGIYTDIGGTMRLIAASGDVAPGAGTATYFYIDHPVVSGHTAGSEHVAYLGTLTGAGVTANVNDKGVWRSTNGAPPTLVLRTGSAMTTSQGGKTVFGIDLPGSTMDVRPWELPVMDDTGRILLIVTFTDGSTAQVIAQ